MHQIAKLGCASAIAAILLSLAGCGQEIAKAQLSPGLLPPVVNPITEINQTLRNLPSPSKKVVVAVYNYTDQTGQFKPIDTVQTLSKAVTQGATSVLIKALQDVGHGSWFTVVERERIDNLIKERTIVTQMRMLYLGEKKVNPQALPPLLFAGIIFEGGIIGYDSNIQTGGIGARLLGIGGDVKYRLDTITIYLRAVSTKTGQVLASVTTHKTIASVGIEGNVFKYISLDKILEADAGFTKNEPDQIAIQQAIEKAVYSMVVQGAALDIWSFADKQAQSKLIEQYRTEQEGTTVLAAAGEATAPASQAKSTKMASDGQVASAAVTAALPEKAPAARNAPPADHAPAHTSAIDSAQTPLHAPTIDSAEAPPLPSRAPPLPISDRASAQAEPWTTALVTLPPLPERPPAARGADAADGHAGDAGQWTASVVEEGQSTASVAEKAQWTASLVEEAPWTTSVVKVEEKFAHVTTSH